MKQLNTFEAKKYPLQDDEARNIKKVINRQDVKFVDLRSGDTIAVSSIVSITKVEIEKYWQGNLLSKGGKSFMRDGRRLFLEKKDFSKIEERPIFSEDDLKFKVLNKSTKNKLLNK